MAFQRRSELGRYGLVPRLHGWRDLDVTTQLVIHDKICDRNRSCRINILINHRTTSPTSRPCSGGSDLAHVAFSASFDSAQVVALVRRKLASRAPAPRHRFIVKTQHGTAAEGAVSAVSIYQPQACINNFSCHCVKHAASKYPGNICVRYAVFCVFFVFIGITEARVQPMASRFA